MSYFTTPNICPSGENISSGCWRLSWTCYRSLLGFDSYMPTALVSWLAMIWDAFATAMSHQFHFTVLGSPNHTLWWLRQDLLFQCDHWYVQKLMNARSSVANAKRLATHLSRIDCTLSLHACQPNLLSLHMFDINWSHPQKTQETKAGHEMAWSPPKVGPGT